MKGKKVLFLIHTLQVGGAEKVLVNLVNNMDKEKYDITVMTVINTGAFRNELNSNIKYKTIFNIPFLSKKSNKKDKSGNLLDKTSFMKQILANMYKFMWRHINCQKLYKKYIKENYDVEIAFLEGISAKVIANSMNPNSKKMAWIHVDLLQERKTESFFLNHKEEKEVYEKFDNIICVSKNVKEQFIKKFEYKDFNKVIVKYNPIDEEYIRTKSYEEIQDIKKTRTTLCTVGRLSKQKGYDRLLKVVKQLNENDLLFDLWIIGVGSEEEKLRKYINENHLENVKLLGYKKNPYKYMKEADIFVCSSIAEGFSTVVTEAVILGIPIVTTECSGMREILGENGEYGTITENTQEGLFIGLKNILGRAEILDKHKEKVAKRKQMFNIKNSVSEIEQLIGV